MNPQDQNDPISRLQRELYKRDAPDVLHESPHSFAKKSPEVKGQWAPDALSSHIKERKGKASFLKKSFIFSIIFFVLAVLTALFVAFGGFNFISSQKVEIAVEGKSSVEGGEQLALDVSVVNNNRTAIEDLVLTVEYPEGAKNPKNPRESLRREEQTIDRIASQDKASRTFTSILYGERQSVKDIKVTLSYKTEGSAAVFTKETQYEVSIKSAPVLITVDFPKELSDGQTAEFKVAVTSNSPTTLTDLLLTVDYPFGFAPSDFSEAPVFEDNVWSIGTLKPEEKKEFTIKGTLAGQENEEKVFTFAVGVADPDDERLIGIELVSDLESIFLRKPFMTLGIDIDKTTNGDYVTQMGSTLKVKINWQNNLSVDLNDAVFELKLAGKSVDKLSVSPSSGGFYKSQDDVVIWDKNTTSDLARIRPDQTGDFNITISTIEPPIESVGLFKNSTIDLTLTVKGVRFFESQPPGHITTSVGRKVKMETDLALSPRTVYSIGPFHNTGPIPPEAEETTTYTIIWSVSDTWNDADNVSVSAKLPIYVDWLGKVSPANAQVSFNEDTRIISWDAGLIKAGTGFLSAPKEVAFQILFTPSLGQVGEVPILVEEPTIIGTDTFTDTDVSEKKPALTTRITTDPIYTFGSERVVH